MTRNDREAQKVIDALGFELIRVLTDKPTATDRELRLLIRRAIKAVKQHVEIDFQVQPHDNEKERLEGVLDWLKSQKGGSDDRGNK